MCEKLSVAANACDPRIWEAEAGEMDQREDEGSIPKTYRTVFNLQFQGDQHPLLVSEGTRHHVVQSHVGQTLTHIKFFSPKFKATGGDSAHL